MPNCIYKSYSRLIVVCLLIGYSYISHAQLADDLKQRLSVSDQQKLQKAEDANKKAIRTEDESKYLIPTASTADNQKAEKKYLDRRTEASALYQKAHSDILDIYSVNIKSFWKKFKGDNTKLDSIKKVELAALDTFKKAQELRSNFKKIERTMDKIDAMIKAEKLENKAIVITQKVLMTYLNWPASYNYSWLTADDNTPSSNNTTKKDSSLIKKESADSDLGGILPATPAVVVAPTPSPKAVAPVITNLASRLQPNESLAMHDKPNVVETKSANQAVSSTIVTTEKKSTKTSEIDTTQKVVKAISKDTFKTETAKPVLAIADTSTKVSIPQALDTTSKAKAGNSIYEKIEINEKMIDQFNKFLVTTYPDDYETYVIDYSKLDYSNVEQIRQAWTAYVYGPSSVDSSFFKSLALNSVDNNPTSATQGELTKAADSTKAVSAKNETLAANVSAKNQKTSKSDNTKASTDKNKKNDKYITVTQNPRVGKGKVEEKSVVVETAATGPKTIATETKTETVENTAETKNPIVAQAEPEVSTNSATPKASENKRNKTTKGSTSSKISKAETETTISAVAPSPKTIAEKSVKIKKQADHLPVVETSTVAAKGFIFRLQIVCCKVKMDAKTLAGIYDGNEKIVEAYEDGWYKYAIGEFPTYKDAKEFKENEKIPGAFVISYVNGKRIKITPAVASNKWNGDVDEFAGSSKIQFRIQIAASKVLLSQKYLINIYDGNSKIEMLEENGWYKYSVFGGNAYNEAKELAKKIEVPGAFIVAYQGKNKLDLRDAIKQTSK